MAGFARQSRDEGPPLMASTVAVLSVDAPLTRALARRLAAEGADVVLVGQDGQAAGTLLAEIERAGRGRAHFFLIEQGHDAEIDGLAEFVTEQFRR